MNTVTVTFPIMPLMLRGGITHNIMTADALARRFTLRLPTGDKDAESRESMYARLFTEA